MQITNKIFGDQLLVMRNKSLAKIYKSDTYVYDTMTIRETAIAKKQLLLDYY